MFLSFIIQDSKEKKHQLLTLFCHFILQNTYYYHSSLSLTPCKYPRPLAYLLLVFSSLQTPSSPCLLVMGLLGLAWLAGVTGTYCCHFAVNRRLRINTFNPLGTTTTIMTHPNLGLRHFIRSLPPSFSHTPYKLCVIGSNSRLVHIHPLPEVT